MNLCEFKGLTNSAIQAGKLLTLKNGGFGKHWLFQISLFKVDIRMPPHPHKVPVRSL